MTGKKSKKWLASALAGAILLNLAAFGAPIFADMPQNWSTAALQAAVDNGLLQGIDGKILPNEPLTRAQMAAIVSRAFGATEQASLAEFSDVPQEDWYYNNMATAVEMKILFGSNGKLEPNAPITREQAFAVMARALQLSASDASVLGAFSDAERISQWAVPSVASMVKAGLVTGQNGKLDPKSTITRAQFAQLMHNCIKSYVKSEGTADTVADGSVMVNAAGAVIKNQHIKGDLIIGDGVGDGDVTIENVKIDGRILVRGGGTNSIELLGTTTSAQVVISRVSNSVRVFSANTTKIDSMLVANGKTDVIIEGKVGTLTIDSSVPVTMQNAKIETVAITAKNASVTVDKSSVITSVEAKASSPVINVAGTVGTITINAAASGSQIGGDGKVSNANIAANDVKINTQGTTTKVESGVSGTTSNGNAISGGSTVTTTPDKPTPPSQGGDNGGGSTDNRATFPAAYLIVSGAAEAGKPYAFAGNSDYRPATISEGKAFQTIAQAVAAAQDNDTIYITEGVYETYAQIERPLKLVGEDAELVTITVPKNSMCSLVLGTVKPPPYGKDISGTEIREMTFVTPAKQVNSLDTMAIYLTGKGSEDNEIIIRDCVFKGANTLAEADQHVGISTPYSALLGNFKIMNNSFSNMKYAMYFNSLKNAEISGNKIDGTRYNAINIAADSAKYPASNITVHGNTLTNISYQNFDDPAFSSGIYVGPNSNDTVTVAQDNSITMLNGKLPVYFAEKPKPAATKIYISSNGRDENSGTTAAEPVKTLEKAAELIISEGIIVVVGEVSAPTVGGVYSIGADKSITYVGNDTSSKLIFNEDVSFEGDTTFRDIKLDFTKEYHYVYANGHKFTFDTGVTTKPLDTKYSANSLYLFGGGLNRDVESTDVTIKSGRIHYLFGGGKSVLDSATANVNKDTNITITGGYIDDSIIGGGYTSTNGNIHGQVASVGGVANITIDGGLKMGWYNSRDELNEGTIYSGGWALSNGGNATVPQTNTVLRGLTDFNASVLGGGHSDSTNSTAAVNRASIVVENVTMSGTVMGGGLVFNSGNIVDVDQVHINIKDSTIAEVFGGSWVGSGNSATTENVFITLDGARLKGIDDDGGVTDGNFYAGGFGDSLKSVSTVENATVTILNGIYFADSDEQPTFDTIKSQIHMYGYVDAEPSIKEILGNKKLTVDGNILIDSSATSL